MLEKLPTLPAQETPLSTLTPGTRFLLVALSTSETVHLFVVLLTSLNTRALRALVTRRGHLGIPSGTTSGTEALAKKYLSDILV